MPGTQKLSEYRTTWEHDATGSRGSVTYVSTRIVEWHANGTVTLNSGGWRTVTTKRKMNQASNQFALRFGVHQRKGEWFVDVKSKGYTPEGDAPYRKGLAIPFHDGMVIDIYTGEVLA